MNRLRSIAKLIKVLVGIVLMGLALLVEIIIEKLKSVILV